MKNKKNTADLKLKLVGEFGQAMSLMGLRYGEEQIPAKDAKILTL